MFDKGGSGYSYSPEQVFRGAARYSRPSQYTPYGSVEYSPDYRTMTMQMSPIEQQMYLGRAGLGRSALANAMAWFGGNPYAGSQMYTDPMYDYNAGPGGGVRDEWNEGPIPYWQSSEGEGGNKAYSSQWSRLASMMATPHSYPGNQEPGFETPEGGGGEGGAGGAGSEGDYGSRGYPPYVEPPPTRRPGGGRVGPPDEPGWNDPTVPPPGGGMQGGWGGEFAMGAPDIQYGIDWNKVANLDMPSNLADTIAGVERSTMQRARNLLDPYYADLETRQSQEMANRGLPETSEIYNWQRENLGRERARAYEEAALGSVAAGRQEHQRLSDIIARTHEMNLADQIRQIGLANQARGQRFGELGAVMGWGGGASPTLGSFYGPGGLDTSPYQIAQQGSMFGAQQQQAGMGGLLGGLSSLLPLLLI